MILLSTVFLAFSAGAPARASDSSGFVSQPDTGANSSTTGFDPTYASTKVRCCNPGEICPDNKVAGTNSPTNGNNNGVFGTMAPCPPYDKPMAMRDTPRASFVGQAGENGGSAAQTGTFTPYLYIFACDPSSGKPYSGTMYRGTAGDTTQTFSMLGNTSCGTGTNPGSSGATGNTTGGTSGNTTSGSSSAPTGSEPDTNLQNIANCKTWLKFASDPHASCKPNGNDASSCADYSKSIRMQLDTCANLYILQAALYPFQHEDATAQSMENPQDPSERISGRTSCQPLRMATVTDNEYSAGYYLTAAWKKLLQNAGTRIDKKDPLEPHLPDGVTIQNPVPPPKNLASVTLSTLSTYKYEALYDPSHPFSPRWDFETNDRQGYSPLTAAYTDDQHAKTLKNSVFCAGAQEDDGYSSDKNTDDVKKCPAPKSLDNARKSMPVDVLYWRKCSFEGSIPNILPGLPGGIQIPAAFRSDVTCPIAGQSAKPGMLNRIDWNAKCFADDGTMDVCRVYNKALPCWKCFYPSKGGQKVDYIKKSVPQPPCATQYNQQDLPIVSASPSVGNWGNKVANCRFDQLNLDADYSAAGLCKALRKPFRPLNSLKMRYHNPLDAANDQLPQGAPEGMTFREYFCDHMPYPLVLDAGHSLQKGATSAGANDQLPTDSYGQWTAIVGVGREGAPGSGQSTSSGTSGSGSDGSSGGPQKEERCLYGGWGGSGVDKNEGWTEQKTLSVAGASITLPDPVTSWTELKLYQIRTLRAPVGHLSCLGRYEKVFKPGSSEGLSLLASGSEFSTAIVTECSQNAPDKPCTYSAAGNTDTTTTGSSTTSHRMVNLLHEVAPRSWRGYLSAKDAKQQFPISANGGATNLKTGLDNAECGDMVLLPQGTETGGSNVGLAKVGIVAAVNLPKKNGCNSTTASTCVQNKNCYVKVVESDNGKWPDVCGTTDNWNEMRARYFFKKGMLPSTAANEAKRVGWTVSCDDTRLLNCEPSNWDTIKLYPISKDSRKGSATGAN